MKQTGIHRAIKAQLARRGGFKADKGLPDGSEIDGYIQSLRGADLQSQAAKKDNNRTGGYCDDLDHSNNEEVFKLPPGLSVDDLPLGHIPETYQVENEGEYITTPDVLGDGEANPWVVRYPHGVDLFDFTQPEEHLRGRCLVVMTGWYPKRGPSQQTVEGLECTTDSAHIEDLVRPYLEFIEEDLHCTLVNWLDRHTEKPVQDFEALSAEGLRNVMAHGNSYMRRLASPSLSQMRCLGRFHAGILEYAG